MNGTPKREEVVDVFRKEKFKLVDAVMKELKIGMGRRGVRFLEEGRESGDYLASYM